jgi:pimeloyl-ACP methyl ester carboxylesterase
MTIHERYVEVDGAALRVRTGGAGPALVLLHGWALDLGMWERQLESFARSFRVVAYDRRGFGRSSGEPGIERDVADLGALLDALAIERASIVAMSQGARVALRFALVDPARVERLVLDGPPDETAAATAEEVPLARYRELLEREGIDAVRREWLRHPLMRLYWHDARTLMRLRAIVARYPGNDLRATSPPPAPVGERLREIAIPALVINGAHDSARRRAAGAALAAALPDARHAIVPAAGHLPNMDCPGAWDAVVTEFLGRRRGAPVSY